MASVTKEYLEKQLHNFETGVLDNKYATPYTAGNGIEINGDEISIDIPHFDVMPSNDELIAMASDYNTHYFTTDGFYSRADGNGGMYSIARGGGHLKITDSNGENARYLLCCDEGLRRGIINPCKYGLREYPIRQSLTNVSVSELDVDSTYAAKNSEIMANFVSFANGTTLKFPKGRFVFETPIELINTFFNIEGNCSLNAKGRNALDSYSGWDSILYFPFLTNGQSAITLPNGCSISNVYVIGAKENYNLEIDRTKIGTVPDEMVTETINDNVKCTGISIVSAALVNNVYISNFYYGIRQLNNGNSDVRNVFSENCYIGILTVHDIKLENIRSSLCHESIRINGSLNSVRGFRCDSCITPIHILYGKGINLIDIDADFVTDSIIKIGNEVSSSAVHNCYFAGITGRACCAKAYNNTVIPSGIDVRDLANTDGYGLIRLIGTVNFYDNHIVLDTSGKSRPTDSSSDWRVPNIIFTFADTVGDIHTNTFEVESGRYDYSDEAITEANILKSIQTKSGMTARVDCSTGTYYINGTSVEHAVTVTEGNLGTAAFKNSTDRVQPNSTDLVESQSVYSAINTALSSIYTPRGDITCAELTSDLLIAANVGNIYETSDSGTTSALFLQGVGVPIPTGSNVGIISAGQGRILFNLMANAFDLTGYQKADLTQAVEGETTVEGALGALSSNKVDKASGKGLSTNDYDNTEKQKVANAIQKSQTAGLVKNDGTVDTTAYAKQNEMSVTNGTGADTDKTTIQLKTGTSATVLKAHQDLTSYQTKTLNTAITIGGVSKTTVEDALAGFNGLMPSVVATDNKLVSASQLNARVREVYRVPYNMSITNLLARFTNTGVYTGMVFIEGSIGDATINAWCSYEATIVSADTTIIGMVEIVNANNGARYTYYNYNNDWSLKTNIGIHTIWTGSATKGATDMNFNAAPYDEVYALIGGTWTTLCTGRYSGATTRKKFTTVYSGRDYADAVPYQQYYLLDITPEGVIATCGWFNIAGMNRANAALAAKAAFDQIKDGATSYTAPTNWKTLADYETNITLSKIVGITFPKF